MSSPKKRIPGTRTEEYTSFPVGAVFSDINGMEYEIEKDFGVYTKLKVTEYDDCYFRVMSWSTVHFCLSQKIFKVK